MRLKASVLAALLIFPTASRVQAGGAPETNPKVREKKKIVVVSPDREVVVDDDGMFVSDEDGEMFADLRDFEGLPEVGWFEGGGYIGVRPVEMTPDLRVHFGAPKEAGVFVGKVEKDSPAAKAGLQVADILTSADGEKIGSTRDLVRAIRRKKEGETVKLELLRDRAPKTLSVTVAEREGGKVRVGDFGPGMRKFKFRHWPVPPTPPVAPVPPASPDLQERLDELEKRLDALEGRNPKN